MKNLLVIMFQLVFQRMVTSTNIKKYSKDMMNQGQKKQRNIYQRL